MEKITDEFSSRSSSSSSRRRRRKNDKKEKSMLVVWRQERERERKVLLLRGLTDGRVLRVLTSQYQQGKKEEVEVADVWEEEEQERHWQRYH
jgi:hypothetical protein